jgi:hypothetical protein
MSLPIYPLKCFKKDKHGRDQEELKSFLIERGSQFYELQKDGCWNFQGFTTDATKLPVGTMTVMIVGLLIVSRSKD